MKQESVTGRFLILVFIGAARGEPPARDVHFRREFDTKESPARFRSHPNPQDFDTGGEDGSSVSHFKLVQYKVNHARPFNVNQAHDPPGDVSSADVIPRPTATRNHVTRNGPGRGREAPPNFETLNTASTVTPPSLNIDSIDLTVQNTEGLHHPELSFVSPNQDEVTEYDIQRQIFKEYDPSVVGIGNEGLVGAELHNFGFQAENSVALADHGFRSQDHQEVNFYDPPLQSDVSHQHSEGHRFTAPAAENVETFGGDGRVRGGASGSDFRRRPFQSQELGDSPREHFRNHQGNEAVGQQLNAPNRNTLPSSGSKQGFSRPVNSNRGKVTYNNREQLVPKNANRGPHVAPDKQGNVDERFRHTGRGQISSPGLTEAHYQNRHVGDPSNQEYSTIGLKNAGREIPGAVDQPDFNKENLQTRGRQYENIRHPHVEGHAPTNNPHDFNSQHYTGQRGHITESPESIEYNVKHHRHSHDFRQPAEPSSAHHVQEPNIFKKGIEEIREENPIRANYVYNKIKQQAIHKGRNPQGPKIHKLTHHSQENQQIHHEFNKETRPGVGQASIEPNHGHAYTPNFEAENNHPHHHKENNNFKSEQHNFGTTNINTGLVEQSGNNYFDNGYRTIVPDNNNNHDGVIEHGKVNRNLGEPNYHQPLPRERHPHNGGFNAASVNLQEENSHVPQNVGLGPQPQEYRTITDDAADTGYKTNVDHIHITYDSLQGPNISEYREPESFALPLRSDNENSADHYTAGNAPVPANTPLLDATGSHANRGRGPIKNERFKDFRASATKGGANVQKSSSRFVGSKYRTPTRHGVVNMQKANYNRGNLGLSSTYRAVYRSHAPSHSERRNSDGPGQKEGRMSDRESKREKHSKRKFPGVFRSS